MNIKNANEIGQSNEYIYECSNCGKKFKGGKFQNRAGGAYSKHIAKEKFDKHIC